MNEEDSGSQYSAGYQKCIEEIGHFFHTNKSVSKELQTSILKHVDTQNSTVIDKLSIVSI